MLKKFFSVFKDIFIRKHLWKINFFYETIDHSDIRALFKFLFTAKPLKRGEYIEKYEMEFKKYFNNYGYAFSFGTGRMALYAILDALNIDKGDEVILPAFTCEVVVHALLYRGIKPVYADIDEKTLNMNTEKIEELITSKTRAVIAQHTFGVPCNLDKILALSEKYGFYVIEDCALAFGSGYKGKLVGSYGHASFFSTDRTKMLSTMWGGMAFTKDNAIGEKIKNVYNKSAYLSRLQVFNIALQVVASYVLFNPYLYIIGGYIMGLLYRSKLFFDYKDDKVSFQKPLDYPSCLSNLQSALALNQLDKFKKILSTRRKTVERYSEILNKNGVNLEGYRIDETTLRFSVLLEEREKFIRKWKKYFEVGNWFNSPVFGWNKDLDKIGYKEGSCPVAEFVHKHIVNFPTHQRSDRIQNYLYEIIGSIKPEEIVTYEEN